MNDKAAQIEKLIKAPIENLGYALVNIIFSGKGSLQITVERNDGSSVDLNDCEKISSTVSALLDVADIISDKYMLEVSSPGVNRLLTKIEEFQRFMWYKIKVELIAQTLEGSNKRKIQGVITNVSGNNIELALLPEKEKDKDKEKKTRVKPLGLIKQLKPQKPEENRALVEKEQLHKVSIKIEDIKSARLEVL